MDIHVDIRGFLEIHAWICYGFSDQESELDFTSEWKEHTSRSISDIRFGDLSIKFTFVEFRLD